MPTQSAPTQRRDSDNSGSDTRRPESSSTASTSTPRYVNEASVTAHADIQREQSIEARNISRRESAGASGDIPTGESTADGQTNANPQPGAENQASEGGETGSENASEQSGAGSDADAEVGEERDAASDAETSVDAADGEPSGSRAAGGSDDAPSSSRAAGSRASSQSNGEAILMLAAELPKLSPILAPHVGSPPHEAVVRRDEIIKRTGAPPELNHAQVRQTAQQVTQFARDQQRRMLFRVGDIAGDTRVGIEAMADEVANATQQAIGQVNAKMDSAVKEIKTNTEEEIAYVRKKKADVSEQSRQNRDRVTSHMYQQLRQGSDAIAQLQPKAEEIYSSQLNIASGIMPSIPEDGEVGRVPPGDEGVEHPEGDYKKLSDADEAAGTFIGSKADLLAGDKTKTHQYLSERARAVLRGRSAAQQQLLQTANDQALARLSEQVVKDQLMIRVLGMTTPAREEYDQDAATARFTSWQESHNQLNLIDHATEQAVFQLQEKQGMALDYCNEFLRPKLTSSLRKQGNKAEEAMRTQAEQAEIGLQTSAAHMADDYRKLIASLDSMLPDGKFFDARKKVPSIMLLRDKLVELLRVHEEVAQAQSIATLDSHKDIMRRQIKGLMKAAGQAAQSIQDLVTRIDFDMALFAQQTTGEIREGDSSSFGAANTLADDTAKNMLSTNGELRESAIEKITNAAAGLLNQHIHSAEHRQFSSLKSYYDALTTGQNNGHLGSEMQQKDIALREAASTLDGQIPDRDLGDMAGRLVTGNLSGIIDPGAAIWNTVSIGYELYETDPEENAAIATLARFQFPGPGAVAEHFEALGHGSLVQRFEKHVHEPQKSVATGLINAATSTAHAAWAVYGMGQSAAWYDPWGLNREAREALGSSIDQSGYEGLQSSSVGRQLLGNTREALSGEWWQTGMNRDERDVALAYTDHNRERVVAARTREALRKGRMSARFGFIFSNDEAIRRTEDARTEALQTLHRDLQSELEVEAGFVSQNQLAQHLDSMYQEVASLDEGGNRDRSVYSAEQGRESLRDMATQTDQALVLGFSPLADVMATGVRIGALLSDRELSQAENNLLGISSRAQSSEISQAARDYIDAMIDARPGSEKGAEESRRTLTSSRRAFAMKRTENSNALGQWGEAISAFGVPGLSELLNSESLQTLSVNDQNRMTDAFKNDALDNIDRQLATETNPAERRRLESQRAVVWRQHQQDMQQTAREMGAPETVWNDPERAMDFVEQRVGDVFARADNHAGNSAPVSMLREGWQSVFGESNLPGFTPEGYSHRTYGSELIRRGRASIEASTALASEGIGTNDNMLKSSWANRSPEEWRTARATWRARYGESIETTMGIAGREFTAGDLALGLMSPVSWLMLRGGEVSGDLAMELEASATEDGTDRGMFDTALLRFQQQRVRGTGVLGRQIMEGTIYAQNLDERKGQLGALALDAIRDEHPDLAARFDADPSLIFSDPAGQHVLNLAFDENNQFRGDRMRLAQLTGYMRVDADAYRNELDRQERIITGAITIMAMIATAVATIVAMFIPGLNVAVVMVATAIIAGTATMMVKAGMRGERYGWEEAATDVAMMAVEAAAAGVGAGLAGGAGEGVIGGALGRLGASLQKSMVTLVGNEARATIAAAVVRESAVAMASGMAQTALQDGTWDGGIARGLENMLGGGLRSASVAAVTAGVSESVSLGLKNVVPQASQVASQLDNAPSSMRNAMVYGREAFIEAGSEFLGTAAGETVGIGIDYGSGRYHGSFWDSMKIIGGAALRDAASGAIRGASQHFATSTFHHLVQAYRNNEAPVSPEHLAALHHMGRVAGVVGPDQGVDFVQREISLGRELISGLPSVLRPYASGMDVETLRNMHALIQRGSFGDKGPESFKNKMETDIPGIDSRGLMKHLQAVIASRVEVLDSDTSHEDGGQIQRLLNHHLEPDLHRVLSEQNIDALKYMYGQDMQDAAAMIASGSFRGEIADALYHRAKQKQANLDEATFLSQLMNATQGVREARALVQDIQVRQYHSVMAHLEEESRVMFGNLSSEDITLIHHMMKSGEISAQERRRLFQKARENNAALNENEFYRAIEKGVARAQKEITIVREHARAERENSMHFVPESQRALLSILPSDALLLLRVRQQQGEALSSHDLNFFVKSAQKHNAEIDVSTFTAAIHATIRQAPSPLDPQRAIQLREAMLAGVPATERHKVVDVEIIVMRDSEFEAVTRSAKGDAVTLIVHGRPVIVMREGADPSVLREEGIHALQAKDPKWLERIESLDERHLADWDSLSLAEQLRLYRNKVELEIDAQMRVMDSIERDLQSTQDAAERERLQHRFALTQSALGNLIRRQREAHAIGPAVELAILAGKHPRPQWLDQPARLFSKNERRENDTEGIGDAHAPLVDKLAEGLQGKRSQAIRDLAQHLSAEQLRILTDANLPLSHVRAVLRKLGGGDVAEFKSAVSVLTRALSAAPVEHGSRIVKHLSSPGVGDYQHYIHHLGRILDVVEPAMFARLVETLYREIGKNAEWIDKVRVENVATLVENLGRERMLDLSVIAPTKDQLRDLLTFLAKQQDHTTLAQKLTAIMNIVSDGEKRQRALEWFINPRSGNVAEVINKLYDLRQHFESHMTFEGMVDVVVAAGKKLDVIAGIAELAQSLDREGRRALADLSEHVGTADRAKILLELIEIKHRFDAFQSRLDPQHPNHLFNLALEMASGVARQRSQWREFMKQMEVLLTSVDKLEPGDTNNHVRQTILEYLYSVKSDSPAGATPSELASRPDYADRMRMLATDITAAAKQLVHSESGDLLPLDSIRSVLQSQAGNLADPNINKRHLASKDPWMTSLLAQGANYPNLSQHPRLAEFARLAESVRGDWDAKQLGMLMKLGPWFEHIARQRGLDLANPDDTAALEGILVDLMLRPKLRNELKKVGVDILSQDPNDLLVIQQTRARLLAHTDKNSVKDLLDESRFVDLQRAFREAATEADIAANRASADDSGESSHARRIAERRAALLSHLQMSEADLQSRPDAAVLEAHIQSLLERQFYYDRMGEIAAEMREGLKLDGADDIASDINTAGIAQNVTEARGEIALTLHILAGREGQFRDFVLAMPFGKGTGFDQVWIRTSDGSVRGDIVEVIIAEAKGPGAKLGSTEGKGDQMTAEWVAGTLMQMANSGDATTRALARRLMEAQQDLDPRMFRGLVIEAVANPSAPPPFLPSDITEGKTGKTGWDFSNHPIIATENSPA